MLISELPIKESVKSNLKLSGFITATPVQAATIPSLLKTDVIVQSETGSGKTLAFLLPIAHVLEKDSRKIQALVIVPTRELCKQIQDVCKLLNMNCQSFIGGSDVENDKMILECQGKTLQSVDCLNEDTSKRIKISNSKENHDINESISNSCISLVAATPGRILELLHTHSKYFSNIKYLILDEADKLLSAGFETKILEIISLLPKSRKTGLFSATINEGVERICRACLRQPKKIILEGVPSGLELTYLRVKSSDKIKLAMTLIMNDAVEVIDSDNKSLEDNFQKKNCNSLVLSKGDFSSKKSIIFFATCAQVDFYYSLLQKLYEGRIELRKIHGKMPQYERNEIYDGFSGGILLCTDVAARGIDFKQIELVIHYDVPKDSENIVHRSGRTARCKQNGTAVLFLMDNEINYINYLKVIGISISEFGDIVGKNHAEDTPVVLNHDSTNQLFLNLNKNPFQYIDDNLLSLSVKAFVSYIRSYKEHKINHILNYKDLDFDELADTFYLKKIPQMNELKNVVFKNYTRGGKIKGYDDKLSSPNGKQV